MRSPVVVVHCSASINMTSFHADFIKGIRLTKKLTSELIAKNERVCNSGLGKRGYSEEEAFYMKPIYLRYPQNLLYNFNFFGNIPVHTSCYLRALLVGVLKHVCYFLRRSSSKNRFVCLYVCMFVCLSVCLSHFF